METNLSNWAPDPKLTKYNYKRYRVIFLAHPNLWATIVVIHIVTLGLVLKLLFLLLYH